MSNLIQSVSEKIKTEAQKIIVGQEELFELVVVSFLSGGHVLLEVCARHRQNAYCENIGTSGVRRI